MLFNLQFKKILVIFTIATVFFTFLMFFQNSADVNAQAKMNYTGEELYKGIVFGQGKVTSILPHMWDEKTMEKANSKEALELTNQLINEMKLIDYNYFNNLKSSIDSKNPVKINQALEDGSDLLKKGIDKLNLNAQSSEIIDQAGVGNQKFAAVSLPIIYLATSIYFMQVVDQSKTNLNISPAAGLGIHSNLEKEKVIQYIMESF
ncbi:MULTISPECIES: sporulation delaying protein family toxin [Bacillus cereus group]|uniref:sporulation delaying protein family toxin n=1 Tax=Bacillus cereus group TaxID=86661 RepID=UPI000BF6FD4B|nr:sporulation delaying protein family toxin [Bacillus thuringiensis]MBZ3766587.1 sporulation delaying protein family toxin [Bacillus cereus]PFK91089.1 hypothetical protein COJ04_21420 [Bacillus thuringiensis]PFP14313.1 hypothetical protein COJ91_00085 [Bacillus thuringiensis]PGP46598.1 hypothetical protein CN992_29290 [Bacillus thuringiensis]PGY55162.1 hypothetical protein COE24_25065 [Bacillus thuringiensis]